LKDGIKIDLRKIGLQSGGDYNHVVKHKFSGGVFSIVTNYLLPRKRVNSLINCVDVSSSWKALRHRFSPRLRLVDVCYGPYTRSYTNMKLLLGGTKCTLLFILGKKLNFYRNHSQDAKLFNQKLGSTYDYHYLLNGGRKWACRTSYITKDAVGRYSFAQQFRRCEMKSFKSDDKWFLIIQWNGTH
jgi:hypothetical protein